MLKLAIYTILACSVANADEVVALSGSFVVFNCQKGNEQKCEFPDTSMTPFEITLKGNDEELSGLRYFRQTVGPHKFRAAIAILKFKDENGEPLYYVQAQFETWFKIGEETRHTLYIPTHIVVRDISQLVEFSTWGERAGDDSDYYSPLLTIGSQN